MTSVLLRITPIFTFLFLTNLVSAQQVGTPTDSVLENSNYVEWITYENYTDTFDLVDSLTNDTTSITESWIDTVYHSYSTNKKFDRINNIDYTYVEYGDFRDIHIRIDAKSRYGKMFDLELFSIDTLTEGLGLEYQTSFQTSTGAVSAQPSVDSIYIVDSIPVSQENMFLLVSLYRPGSSQSLDTLIHPLNFGLRKDSNQPINLGQAYYSAFSDWYNNQNISFDTFFNNFHPIENLYFLQQFYNIHRDTVNSISLKDNSGSYDFNTFFTDFQDGLTPGDGNDTTTDDDDDDPDYDCLCNLIGLNFSYRQDPNLQPNSLCGNAEPMQEVYNNNDWQDKKQVNFRTARFGAAKMGYLRMATANCKGTGNQEFRRDDHFSNVRFRLACLDRENLIISNCNCPKQISIDYKYSSKFEGTADRGNQCFPYVNKGEGYLTLEDYAFLVMSNGDSPDFIETGLLKTELRCDVEEKDISTTLTELGNAIAGVVSGSVEDIIEGAANIIEFVDNIFLYTRACNYSSIEKNILNGNRSFPMNTGEEVIFTVGNYFEYKGYTKRKATIEGRVNSDFYLGAVLEPEFSDSEYCCNDKAASYVMGTVNEEIGYEYDDSRRGNNGPTDQTYEGLINYSPLGINSMRGSLGQFFGLYGPWFGLFDPACGACSDVIVDCLHECKLLKDEACVEVYGRFSDNTPPSFEVYPKPILLKIYPNPIIAGRRLTVESSQLLEKIGEGSIVIDIYSIDGSIYKSMKYHSNSLFFSENFSIEDGGSYFLRFAGPQGAVVSKPIIVK